SSDVCSSDLGTSRRSARPGRRAPPTVEPHQQRKASGGVGPAGPRRTAGRTRRTQRCAVRRVRRAHRATTGHIRPRRTGENRVNRSMQTPPAHQVTVSSADGTPICYQTIGTGPDLIVLGGALRTSEDYLPLASALARSFTVHLVERRGHGTSGPQGSQYALGKEVEDFLAVQAETGARLAFGHSYGGLVILETARSFHVFDRIAVYEPGVPVAPVPTGWMSPYRERLAAGDPYGAFAHFIRGSGGAPAFMAKLPYWYLRFALRIGFRGPSWQRMRPLLQ